MRHYYLQGIMATLTNQPGSAALFNFTKILEELDEGHQTIYSQLAYLGSGILYARRGKMDQADFFFAKVISYLHGGDSERARADQREYLRIIMMMYYVAECHALSQRLAASDRLLREATECCAAGHVTYFMPRIKLLQARNAIAAGATASQVDQLLNEAMMFARFNQSSVVQVQAAALRSNYHRELDDDQ